MTVAEPTNRPNITMYGAPWCPDCKRAKKFLAAQRVPYHWIDVDQDETGLRHIEALQNGGRSIPTIEFGDGAVLIEPSDEEIAQQLGLDIEASLPFYDVAIIGGGPAGLSAAIYGAREGMEVIVIEKSGLGGQAGITDRIDNYPGFPEGISGGELADKFQLQAERYGVELLSAVGVKSLFREGSDVHLELNNGQHLCAHAALVVTGTTYRRLGAPGEDDLIGSGVHFCATCDGPFYDGADELLVVGDGNSALEEALFLADFVKKVRIVSRSPEPSASKLLQEKVAGDSRVELYNNSEVAELKGSSKLKEVTIRNSATGETQTWHPDGAFVFVGLDPNTEFLGDALALDRSGFLIAPKFETSVQGIFGAGDVRAESHKQLAAAVGEGVGALLVIRDYLRTHDHEPREDQVPLTA